MKATIKNDKRPEKFAFAATLTESEGVRPDSDFMRRGATAQAGVEGGRGDERKESFFF